LFTILGSTGFIGTNLINKLAEQKVDYYCPEKFEIMSKENLGHVICCVGLTSDFRQKSFETIEAHVSYVNNFLQEHTFESFLYLSSTRVYGQRENYALESDNIIVNPRKLDHIYNISKIAGEAVCHAMNNSKVRVVRLSNVYGYDAKSENFVFSLIKDAIKGSVVLNSSLSSCKDYISIDNTINALIRIAQRGQHQIYNVASGHNITAGQILNKLKELTNCTIEVKGIDTIRFPKINITRLLREFPFEPDNLLNDLERLVKIYKIKAGVKV